LEFSTTDNSGHLLENAIYLHLRKSGKDIFFFNENKHECDFVQMKKGKVVKLLQVCLQITQDNRLREVNGLIEAMRYFNFTKGMIITANQQDTIISDNMEIEIVPAWKFLLNDN
jgi:predicted AAA+ superfamily ATPase